MANNNDKKVLNVPALRFPEFADKWEKGYFKDVCKITTGNKNTQDKDENGLYPFYVRSQNIERINSWTFDGEAILTAGDGVGVGKVFHYSIGKIGVHQRVYILSNFKCDGKYLYQYFSSRFYNRVKRMSAKNSVDSVRMEMIADMPLYLPSVGEQHKIGKLLALLDERISTQNKIIEKLESLIKGIADKLFQTARETKLLLELAPNITSGTDKNGSGTIPLYGSTGIIGKVKNASQKGNIVLVARVGTIGTVQYVKEPCGVSDNALIVEAGEMTKYIYHFLKTYKFAHITSGTTQPLITASSLKKIAVPTYDIERQTQIVLCLNILERKLDIEKQYLSDIAMMKQYLLHQMFI